MTTPTLNTVEEALRNSTTSPGEIRNRAGRLVCLRHEMPWNRDTKTERFYKLLAAWRFQHLWAQAGEETAILHYQGPQNIYNSLSSNMKFELDRDESFEILLIQREILYIQEIETIREFYSPPNISHSRNLIQDFRRAREQFQHMLYYSHQFTEEDAEEVERHYRYMHTQLPSIVLGGLVADLLED